MATARYDTLETVLNVSRTRVNDAILGIGGTILTDDASFTPSVVNVAWRMLQNKLRAVGYTSFARMKDEFIIPAIPATTSSDPGIPNILTWSGFFDGTNLQTSPVLPQEFMEPLVLWERPNQSANRLGAAQNFTLMDQTLNGIPTNGVKQSRNLNWDWRSDELCVPGSTVVWDLRTRCLVFLQDFPVEGDSIVGSTPVPILDCLSPFANLIAAEFSNTRGDLDAKSFYAMADNEVAEIYSRNTAQPTAYRKASEYGPMRNPYTPGQQQIAPSSVPQQGAQQ